MGSPYDDVNVNPGQQKDTITLELDVNEAYLIGTILREYTRFLNRYPITEMKQVDTIDMQLKLIHNILMKIIPEVDKKAAEQQPSDEWIDAVVRLLKARGIDITTLEAGDVVVLMNREEDDDPNEEERRRLNAEMDAEVRQHNRRRLHD